MAVKAGDTKFRVGDPVLVHGLRQLPRLVYTPSATVHAVLPSAVTVTIRTGRAQRDEALRYVVIFDHGNAGCTVPESMVTLLDWPGRSDFAHACRTLRVARHEAHLSQHELAAKAGIKERVVRALDDGNLDVSLHDFVRYALAVDRVPLAVTP